MDNEKVSRETLVSSIKAYKVDEISCIFELSYDFCLSYVSSGIREFYCWFCSWCVFFFVVSFYGSFNFYEPSFIPNSSVKQPALELKWR